MSPRTINPIKKSIVKRELKKGESAREALKKANYSEGHIRRSTKNKIVKDSMNEILKEYDTKDINTEFVLKHLLNLIQSSIDEKDRSNYNRAVESLGRHLAMFTDKKEVETTVKTSELYTEVLKQQGNRVKDLQDIVVSDN